MGPDFLQTGSFALVKMGGTTEIYYNEIALIVSTSGLIRWKDQDAVNTVNNQIEKLSCNTT